MTEQAHPEQEAATAGSLGVLVGYDGSEGSRLALAWAAEEAALRRLPLTILHIWQVVYPGFVVLPLESLKDAAETLTAKAMRTAQALQPDIEVQRIVECGSPSYRLVEHARRARMLVVGQNADHPFGPRALGSVSAPAVMHAPGQVVLVREADIPPEFQPGRVLVGVDGSITARFALDAALTEARLRGLPLTALCAWPPEAMVASAPFLDEQDLPQVCRQRFEQEVASAASSFPGLQVETVFRTGDPATVLLDDADDAALLVVGSRGRGQVRSFLLGSVSHTVLDRARCPVLVTHEA